MKVNKTKKKFGNINKIERIIMRIYYINRKRVEKCRICSHIAQKIVYKGRLFLPFYENFKRTSVISHNSSYAFARLKKFRLSFLITTRKGREER